MRLSLPWPRALICLNGGTAKLSETLKTKLRRLLVDSLARVAAENAIMLVTGSRDCPSLVIFAGWPLR
jgi:hypothetical protein